MSFLSEEYVWTLRALLYCLVLSSPVAPFCTVFGIMAWGGIFRGTTTREALQRGWTWMFFTAAAGILLWVLLRNYPRPDGL